MTQEASPAVHDDILEKTINWNIEQGSLKIKIHPYRDSKINERNFWLQISFFVSPTSFLPGVKTLDITLLHWEIVDQRFVGEDDDIYYKMNCLMPMEIVTEAKGKTNVLFRGKFIHDILKDYADKNPENAELLNDCIGLEGIRVFSVNGVEFGIALVVRD